MLCTYCNFNPSSIYEIEHCDTCAEYLRMQSAADTVSKKQVIWDKKIYTVLIKTCSHPDIYWYGSKSFPPVECEIVGNHNMIAWPGTDYLFRTIDKLYSPSFAPENPKRGYILPKDCKVISFK